MNPEHQSSQKKDPSFIIICIISLVYSFSAGALWFILPLIAKQFIQNLELIGFLLSVPYILSILIAIPTGVLSDRIGRKSIGILGLVIVILLGLLLINIKSLITFLLFITFLGFSISLINTPFRTYIMDIAPKGKTSEYFGIFISFVYLGLATGPIVTGFLMHDSLTTGISYVSYMYIISGLVGIVLFFLLRETVNTTESVYSGIKNILKLDVVITRAVNNFKELKHLGGVVLLLTVLLCITDGIVWTLEPLYYTHLKINSATGSLIFSMFIIPLILFGLPAGYVADKFGKIKTLSFGLFLSGLGLFLFGISPTMPELFLYSFLTGVGLSFSWASVSGLITDISIKDRGSINGVWSTAWDVGYFIGPFLGGIFAGLFSIGYAFSILGVLVILSLIYILFDSKK